MRWLAFFVVAAIAFPIIGWWRDYPWEMSLAVAVALGGMAWAAVGAARRLWLLRHPARIISDEEP
ncbi:MAG: hypothetical protein AAGD38_02870 [Acidobacteriota bacterium]